MLCCGTHIIRPRCARAMSSHSCLVAGTSSIFPQIHWTMFVCYSLLFLCFLFVSFSTSTIIHCDDYTRINLFDYVYIKYIYIFWIALIVFTWLFVCVTWRRLPSFATACHRNSIKGRSCIQFSPCHTVLLLCTACSAIQQFIYAKWEVAAALDWAMQYTHYDNHQIYRNAIPGKRDALRITLFHRQTHTHHKRRHRRLNNAVLRILVFSK